MPAYLCSAYLRVYRPLSALRDGERLAIFGALSGNPPKSHVRCQKGPNVALLPPRERQEVYTRTLDGEPWVCASFPDVRALESLAAMRGAPTRAGGLLSLEEVEGARIELRRLERLFPGLRTWVLQSLWHVPRRWFVCFDDSERRIEHLDDHPGIRYETSMGQALERVDRALHILGRGVKHPSMIAGIVGELARWLRSFPPDGRLELDYASVAWLFDPDELADDHSAADMWGRIHSLGDGDGAAAAAFQRRLDERWEHRRHVELTN